MRRRFIIGGLLLVGIGVLLLSVFARRNEWPKISVTHLDYTTNSAGRFATFTITNRGGSSIARQSWYLIERPTNIPENGVMVARSRFAEGNSVLEAGASETLLVPVPTNQPTWRLSLTVSHPEGIVNRVVRETLDFANISRTAFGFRSDWIQE